MAGSQHYVPQGAVARFIHGFEEGALALILGAMTLLTFVNVVLRFFGGLNVWSLEVVEILFAWLVLFGAAYGFKITAHLGVDAVLNIVGPGPRRLLGVLAALCCIAYGLLMLKGAWDFWAPFAGLDQTSGRWFPTGLAQTRTRAFIETGQVPMVGWLHFLEGWINDGDHYSKMPVVIPYAILPIAAVLILIRMVQAALAILTGRRESLIVSHEAEEAVEDLRSEGLD
jgi:C4-dicarboxylate transporter, DctQ subunit